MATHAQPTRFGDHPPFKFLVSEPHRSLLIALREAVAPILAVNVFRHFTDHSVTHSDSVTIHVDSLIAPLQATAHALSPDELLILYSACYLHDVGMQYENAGTTPVIQRLTASLAWADLSAEQKLDLVRRHHNEISAELVTRSAKESPPPLGLLLSDAYHPSQVACLCEAHCITPTMPRYAELMGEVPHINMRLLSGLLRLADILDETSHRAQQVVARSLDLPLESQVHWWRHYYTRGVVFDDDARTVTIHFEFPKSRFDEFNGIIPQLQLPWIEQEFHYHVGPFGESGINWRLTHLAGTNPHSTLDLMPDEVTLEMLKEIHRRTQSDNERRRQHALRTFKEARPYIEHQLADLRSKKDTLAPGKYLEALAQLGKSLWDIGSKRSAWMSLAFEYDKYRNQLSIDRRLQIGSQLLTMLIEDDESDMSESWLRQVIADCKGVPNDNSPKQEFLRLAAHCQLLQCRYPEAIATFQDAIACAPDAHAKGKLSADLAEMYLLQGELSKALELEAACD